MQYLRDVHAAVESYSLEGKLINKVELPGIGSASGFHGKADDTQTFYSFTNAVTPTNIYSYDVATGKSTLLRRSNIDFDPSNYVAEQVFYNQQRWHQGADDPRLPQRLTPR